MICPACKSKNNKVIDSRLTESGAAIRRRRVCQACKRRFTTKERLEQELRLFVIKSTQQKVPYNRHNVFTGIEQACYKLDLTEEQIQELVDRVEEDLFGNHGREVTSEQIGAYVAFHLRHLNQVAYVRFMSVYRKYRTVEEFAEEIQDVKVRVAQEDPKQQSLFEG